MDPKALSFVIGLIALTIAIVLRLDVEYALAVLLAYYAFSLLALGDVKAVSRAFYDLLSPSDILVLPCVMLSLLLAEFLRCTGYLDELTRRRIGGFYELVFTPMLIGLLPMPGGALVSAVAIDGVYESRGLSRYWRVYLNYWFRHVWVSLWPLYPALLVTASTLKWSVGMVISYTWVVGVIQALIGVLIGRMANARPTPFSPLNLLKALFHSWVFLLIIPLVLLGLNPALAALIAVIAVLALRDNVKCVKNAVLYALNPRLNSIVLEALLIKNLLIEGGFHKAFLNSLKSNVEFAMLLLPFLIGFISGSETCFAALSIPLFKEYIGQYPYMVIGVFASGLMGVMASPLHLCLALTIRHFKASLGEVYGPIALSVVLTIALSYAAMKLLAHLPVAASLEPRAS